MTDNGMQTVNYLGASLRHSVSHSCRTKFASSPSLAGFFAAHEERVNDDHDTDDDDDNDHDHDDDGYYGGGDPKQRAIPERSEEIGDGFMAFGWSR